MSLYGNIGGMVHGQWKVIHDSGEFTGSAAEYSISGLSGAKKYKLIFRGIGTASADIRMRFNVDGGANYGYQYMIGTNTAPAAARVTATQGIKIGSIDNGQVTFSHMDIENLSGLSTVTTILDANRISGTTVTQCSLITGVWNDTDDITSILFYLTGGSFGIGSRFILLELVDASDGTQYGDMTVQGSLEGCWERVYSTELDAVASSITVSDLDGDSDVIYAIRLMTNSNQNSNTIRLLLNNDSTSSIYGKQELWGTSTTVGASRSTAAGLIPLYSGGVGMSNGDVGLYNGLLYAKTGYERVLIADIMDSVVGTTVGKCGIMGNVYNQTSTNITSMVFKSSVASCFEAGTKIDLYRLNL
jgi:hypothetical protein